MIGPDPKPKKRVKIEIDKHAFRDEYQDVKLPIRLPDISKKRKASNTK